MDYHNSPEPMLMYSNGLFCATNRKPETFSEALKLTILPSMATKNCSIGGALFATTDEEENQKIFTFYKLKLKIFGIFTIEST